MKNQSEDGIFCDYCGDEIKGDFTYYSFDFYEVKITNKFTRQSDHPIMSKDLCERCMELFRQRLLKVAGSVKESLTRCDVTGRDFGSHDQVYYKCRISKVNVNMSSQSYICDNCKQPRDPQEGPCDCIEDAAKLVKVADIDVDEQHLELLFCAEVFAKFKKHIDRLQNIGEAEWTK